MSRTTATICKFIGTISLGLLTGTTYSTHSTSLPPLQHLPTAQPASHTFQHLRLLAQRQQLLLSALSGTSLLLAFALSPARGRHPYLLWATLAVASGYGREIYRGAVGVLVGGGGGGGKKNYGGDGSGKEGANRSRTPDSSDEEWEVEGSGDGGDGGSGGVNGEAVREGMERWGGKMLGRTAVWGVGWLVTVVGLWGDGV